MKALAEIGWRRALRFGFFTAAMVPYRLLLVPQLRAPFLRLLGARIGRRAVLHDVRFFNLYRRGLAGSRSARSASWATNACWILQTASASSAR